MGLVLAAPFACGEPEPQEITAQQRSRLVQIGGSAAATLSQELTGHLQAALQEGGPGHAIEFCSTEAMPATQRAAAQLGQGIGLKRTSFRYRNPDNAPDRAEEAALRYFEERIAEGGEIPGHYLQRVGPDEFRFYKPLFVADLCVNCHGPREGLAPEVIRVLDERYPDDQAVGFQPGDFRGVIRVSVPEGGLSR